MKKVTAILERWQRYRGAVHGGTAGTQPAPARRNSRNGFKSKVLSAEELEEKYKAEGNNTESND